MKELQQLVCRAGLSLGRCRGMSRLPSLLGDRLEERRNELRATLPIGRVVGPADVAALAVHIMSNTALTGATYDIDGGQQFVS
jgi:NAD(P)-dependent dehydrogenase (short-subunit alcohol dehydrogenase family)